ncbi:MAG TPA: hypothetical protein VKV17_11955 [Bryobacteraceae bacterium]|nr:hypothetical protein [Bryobacteraceae bacterium]
MRSWILSAAILSAPSAGLLQAADPQLLNLVMPDTKMLAGINVDQAKTSLFGQFVIQQLQAQDPHFQEFVAETGFDPTKDLDEVLVAANGNGKTASHLVLARGTFDAGSIGAAAKASGATSENYHGVTITENSRHGDGFAFLSGNIAIAGDIASVKAAIDRQSAPSTLPASLLVAVNQLSATEDAWGISEVPLPALKVPSSTPNLQALPANTFQNIAQASGGMKFGAQVVLNAQLLADTAQNATAMANVLQFLLNLGEMQLQQNTQAVTALKSVLVTASGNTVTVSASIPEAQVEALAQMRHNHAMQPNARRPKAQGQQQRF